MRQIKHGLSFAIILLLLFVCAKTVALNYTISFTGSGASTTVDNVVVQNLTKGTTVNIPSGSVLTLSDQVNDIEEVISNQDAISVIPIAEGGNYILSFASKSVGATQISIYSIDGRKVAGINANLQIGLSSFKLALPKGLYAAYVSGPGYLYSKKIISETGAINNSTITYQSSTNTQVAAPQKVKAVNSILMSYSTGDRLLYKGVSGNFSTIVTDIPSTSKSTNFEFVECKDANGNYYSVVRIGNQMWMAENMKATKYRTGDDIINLTNNSDWGMFSISSWCSYSNDVNYDTYGKLYNWYAVSDSRNIAPIGWHVPSDADWTVLTTALGGESMAGAKLKETGISHWSTENNYSTNESGFSAFPSGYRLTSGTFNNLSNFGYWWCSTENNTSYGWYRYISKSNTLITKDYYNKNAGFSLRCVKDADIPTITTTSPTSITYTTAIGGGNITSDGGAPVTAKGVCWSTTANPTTSNNKTVDGTGSGVFSSSIMGLNINTTYYIRAYATNSSGTAYGNQVVFSSQPYDALTATDADGNLYHTITIGNQVWMAENLKTTKYRNGDVIGTTSSINMDLTYATSPKYQWAYNGIESNATIYGRLYTWHVVADPRNLAPAGWHVASDAEWSILENFLISNGYNYDNSITENKISKSLCSTSLWNTTSAVGTPGYDMSTNNKTGLTIYPSGYRGYDGMFYIMGTVSDIWTATEYNMTNANFRGCGYNVSGLNIGNLNKNYGFSVRCIKNSTPIVSSNTPTGIMSTNATCGGNVIANGGETVTEYGICWNTSTAPTIGNSKKIVGTGGGSFSTSISGLSPNTTYYIRAYATNSLGTAYGPEKVFTTLLTDPITVTDVDGNLYHTVTIGTQTWMVENLKTTKYRNGDLIGTTSSPYTNTETLSGPKYQWPCNGDETLVSTYGRLYTWYVVNDARGVAPIGWHVASDAEWTTLQNYLVANGYNSDKATTGNKIAQSIAANAGWYSTSVAGTPGFNSSLNNSSGLSVYPNGARLFDGFYYLGIGFGIWTSSESSSYYAIARGCGYNVPQIDINTLNKNYGYAIRCIKD